MRIRLVAIALGVVAAGLLAGGGNASAPTDAKQLPKCFGAKATIVGTSRSEVIRGTARRDVIVGLAGSDKVYGRGGDDLLCGGPGDDLLDGGAGSNRLHGGPGRDRCRSSTRALACEPSPQPGRDPAPPIAGLTLDGDQVSLADFRGRAVFVNVWASW